MLKLRVEAIQPETSDAATFYLKEASGKKVTYLAGQFITLVFSHHNEGIRRSYSLSSSPHEDLLSITVKRVSNGEISRYLLTHAKVGDIWQAVEPAGRFTLPPNIDAIKTIVYFAAGGGIAPVYAHLKYLLHQHAHCRVILFYSNQSNKTTLFSDELKAIAAQHPEQFVLINMVSNEGRRLNNVTAEQLLKQYAGADLLNAHYYLCGPFTYMRMLQLTLLYMGVSRSQMHKENFVLETVPVNTNASHFIAQPLRIHYHNEWYNLVAGENQTILQAALQNQLPLPYSCANGVCAACAVRCKSGKITIVKNEVLTNDELQQGWILTCTGYAASDDVVLDFDI
jgi:ring-1,2-phenylacetyl-CoA epoxidase subunit PaaE